ncbi:hypothetical protein H2201_002858 [Coniosporium apollinis]|uniref:DDT domain-containing protein n=2 Tax=Coniosporium TaxID=2810619 RepID=A0ABQ9P0G7_9PEZI|nr:hypothetical protein H2199_006519 [Cladosporium sp. JES 115]KAJ9667024.1 hypothetical protein H2201_002858 [Coniosporium apollinis]
MVLIKRKPVQYVPPPPILDNNAEVWVMPETGEVFLDYESYLDRRDYYKQRKFTCEITGHSGLTFFQARDSETQGSKALQSTFPEALRDPVLRRVQFSPISRIDDLVTTVYEEFKENFSPGEHVIVLMENGDRLEGIVRSRTDFGARMLPDGTRSEQYSKYLVGVDALPGQPNEMYLLKDQITRDRKVFTKQTLRAFLKANILREPWQGAPWLVREDVAKELKIPMDIPPHLQHEAVIAQKKAKNPEAGGTFFNFLTSQRATALADLGRPMFGGYRHQLSQQEINRQTEEGQYMFLDGRNPVFATAPVPNSSNNAPYASHFHKLPMLHPGPIRGPPPRPPAPPPPPPIKYPIDDLDIQPRRNGLQRPPLKFLVDDPPPSAIGNGTQTATHSTGILMQSMVSLLEIWNTLNVQAEVFVLDSFTFDDFMDAMRFQSDELECELFVEMHCAVLKQLVSADGQIQVSLPDLEEEEEESEEDISALSTPLPEVVPRIEKRTTRSSLAKSEAEALKQPSPAVSEHKTSHRAAEMLADYGWVERLAARDFKDGGWQVIMVGLLRQVSLEPHHKDICDKILAQLAPVDKEPTQETARRQYNKLNINDRLAALEIAAMLATRTKAIREYLEECSAHMTTLRKEKIEWQRKRKPLVQELQELDEQRKMLLPDNMPGSPLQEVSEILDTSMTGIEDSDKDDEDEPPVRVLRRSTDRAHDRKRKRDEEAARKAQEKADKAAAATSKQSTQFKKILRDIEKKKEAIRECEDKILDFDNDLREENCQRTKCLGRDRFCNRYYWFERNGMPFAGMPNSSTAHYGYANGRLWVQGPDDSERSGFIDREEPAWTEYRNAFGMTVPERRLEEEGPVQLYNANYWGYIDDPDAVDALIGWLDDRGIRERNLRKELQIWRAPIVEYMQKMKAHKEAVEEKRREAEEGGPGVKTRHKTYVDPATLHQCLAWTNTLAEEELGHKHAEQPKPKRSKKASERNLKVPLGRSGKPLTRQGTQYAKR